MAPKAGNKPTINTWWTLVEARARIVEVYCSPRFAEQKLIEWIVGKQVRWQAEEFRIGDRSFEDTHWRGWFLRLLGADPTEWLFSNARDVTLNCEQGWAGRLVSLASRLVAYGMRVAVEDVEAQLPKRQRQ